ncbi:ABC transporter ATP-binding protein [Curtobacterium sp. PhB115]|uniref:ABC transporter ATP-binding protein n=1 Tax=Curtobacterium sp. PhB115 TaxID=2485173 RepID=UPI000FADB173|nr:ABC transporter ATP-binding protein [Curtobacterium sp. PhB115]ROP74323.1 ABC-2 type transport system ATP-binding protein [Curtobacterium sp. PhB115]
MAARRADNEDVYTTSDASWMTEADDTEADDTDADDTDADDTDADDTGADDTGDDGAVDTDTDADDTDDDMGERDARGASADHEMTDDDTTATDTTATDTTATDAESGTRAAAAAPTTTTGPRPTKARTPKQRTNSGSTAAARAKNAAAAPPAENDTAAAPAKKRAARPSTPKVPAKQQPVVLDATGLVKRYGQTLAVDEVDLEIRQGSIFGVVGPNGAGKTTTLSMITGLLRPDAGSVTVLDHDVWTDPAAAKRSLGVLPDRLRLFDRLTGAQLLYYSATLRGLDRATARARSADLAEAFGLGDALGRQVADYSVGMAKKIALAATLIHSPRVLVLDEPFESVDPVSAATITDILRRYTRGGGTVVLSSHSMELVQRTCDSVAIIVGGKVLASGTMAQVRGRKSLEDKFVELAGGRVVAESMEWLHSFSG